ncbi:MAG: hypothetical protein GXP63_03040 [DPANN group archaeon]|nr:hypothetical protein [DPANN group archaeon]
MGNRRQDQGQLLDLLIKSNSLNDLLGILSDICENLDLAYLNPRIKHFRYFQFTFFGLMVKAKSLLEMALFRTEFLRKTLPEFIGIHADLSLLQKRMQKAYAAINGNRMREGKEDIMACAQAYQDIFEGIERITSSRIIRGKPSG